MKECNLAPRILCSKNNIVNSKRNYFGDNIKDKEELSDYCLNLKEDTSFKCERGFRQKFINNIYLRFLYQRL